MCLRSWWSGCGGSSEVFILLFPSQRCRRQGEVNLVNGGFLGPDIRVRGQGIGGDQNWRGLRGGRLFVGMCDGL